MKTADKKKTVINLHAKILAAAIPLIIMCSGLPVPAAEKAGGSYSAANAAVEISEALKTIDSVYYFRNSLDYKELADAAISAVFDKLDLHSEYLTKNEYAEFRQYAQPNKSGIGVLLRKNGAGFFVVEAVYGGSPAEKAGLLKGDVITKINGIDIKDKQLLEMRELLVGDIGTDVLLDVKRNGMDLWIVANRGDYLIPLVERKDISALIEGADNSKTAYVEISTFASNAYDPQSDTARQFENIYKKLKAEGVEKLIIDLRGNSGGDMSAVIDICKLLVKKGKLFTLNYLNQAPDEFFSENESAPEFNIAVLVDNRTASASEVLAASIQQSGTGIIVGSNTYGKGIGQMTLPSADGSHIFKLTVTEIKMGESGDKLHGIGVLPNFVVEPPPYIEAEKFVDERTINENFVINSASPKELCEQLRESLSYIGYLSGEKGAGFDSSLRAALRNFQKTAGFEQDGICGVAVISRINDYVYDKYFSEDVALKKAYYELNK